MQDEYNDLLERLKRLDGNLFRAIAAKQILITADNDELIEALYNAYETHTVEFLLSSVRNELLLALRRILEPKKKDRCSFEKLIEIYKVSGMKEHINSEVLISPSSVEIDDFEERYKKFKDKNDDLIKDISTFRNYHLAHSLNNIEKASFAKEKIKFKELFKLLDEICELFEEFTRIIRGGVFDNTSRNNTWEKYSSMFWKSLSRGVSDDNAQI